MKKNKTKILNEIVDSINSKNPVKELKPKIPKTLVAFIIVIFAVVMLIAFLIDSLDEKEVGFLSNLITISITIAIFYITIYNEKRKDYKLARKNALALSEILDLISKRIIQINNGNRDFIYYPQEWLEYYKSCSLYLNYGYFDVITFEINIVDQINEAIKREDDSLLSEVLEKRRTFIVNSTSDFDIIATCNNLKAFALEKREEKPWKQQKQYKNFDKYILENYTALIKKLTEEHLKNTGGSCSVEVMQDYVTKEMQKDTNFTKGEYSHLALHNKAIFKSIFKVYICLTEEDSFSLCWGVLSLKNE